MCECVYVWQAGASGGGEVRVSRGRGEGARVEEGEGGRKRGSVGVGGDGDGVHERRAGLTDGRCVCECVYVWQVGASGGGELRVSQVHCARIVSGRSRLGQWKTRLEE